MQEELVAPCGMNCNVCIGYFGYTMNGNKRKKNVSAVDLAVKFVLL